jgi:hypothetical protein
MFPGDVTYTLFNYTRGRFQVVTVPISVAIADEKIPANSELWLGRVSRVRRSDGRKELHAMLVSDGAQGRF